MSHAIYQTQAVILERKGMRESNLLLTLYTKRFGLIYVAVQSGRKAESKMRPHLQRLSLVHVDLVEGREIWRLTGVHEHTSAMAILARPKAYAFLDRIMTNIKRLCRGEEAHTRLWQDIHNIYTCSMNTDEHLLPELEIAFLVRSLYALGYWNGQEAILQAKHPFSQDSLLELRSLSSLLIPKINTSLQETQL